MSNTPLVKDTISILFQSQDPPESSQRQGEGKPGRKRLPEGPRSPAGWRYRIRTYLMAKQKGRCAQCQEQKELCLYRSRNGSSPPNWSDYMLLCQGCRAGKRWEKEEERKKRQEDQRKRRQEQLKTEIWTGSSTNFFNQIRELIFQRDGYKCMFCDTKEGLGLTSLIPESKGGSVQFDNYVACCQFCRCSKGNQLPLDFICKREFLPWAGSEKFDNGVQVKKPGVGTRVNLYLVAEVNQFLERLIANKSLDVSIRSKAERLALKLTEDERHKARERKAEVGSWIG